MVNVNMGSIGWSVVRAPFIILEEFFYKLYVLFNKSESTLVYSNNIACILFRNHFTLPGSG